MQSWRTSYHQKCQHCSGIRSICTFVDANNSGNSVWQSHIYVLLFFQNSPVVRLSRGQRSTVKPPTTSIFGSRFVVLWTAHDMTIAMRFKLRMSGMLLLDGSGRSGNVWQKSVSSTKHNNFNITYEIAADAAGVPPMKMEDTQTNLAGLFTKTCPADRRQELLGSIYIWRLWTPKVSDHSMV